MKKKILIITPHLSTGGAPQFTLNKIELLKNDYEIFCVEYDFLSSEFVVQRNKIIDILKNNFFSLGDKKESLLFIIDSIKPDIISIEEISETFIRMDILDKIYSNNRSYKIVETTHSSNNNSEMKKWLPDKFNFVSKYSQQMYSHFGVESDVIEYPVDLKTKKTDESREILKSKNVIFDPNYKHVLNIGLFTSGKNQGYAFEIARRFENKNVMFHFVGNQAGNFKDYWEVIMKNKPSNCIIWGERDDVDDFIQASDLFLFTSKFELNPLVIKEVLCYNMPIMMFNLSTYCQRYDKFDNISFINGNLENDVNILMSKFELEETEFRFTNRNQLPNFLNNLGFKKGAEVGSFKGYFSNTIMNSWSGNLYMVDVWRPLSKEEYDDSSNHQEHKEAYSDAMNSIKGFEDRCFMLRMKSEYATELFQDGSLDFVYIDANHSYEGVKLDISLWYPKVKSGGLVCGHDYLPSDMYKDNIKDIPLYLYPDGKPDEAQYAGMFGVNPAVDEFASDNGYLVQKTDEFLGTWWFIKK